jgi:hypothetical protein
VRKAIRPETAEFRYERGVQPAPKPGRPLSAAMDGFWLSFFRQALGLPAQK